MVSTNSDTSTLACSAPAPPLLPGLLTALHSIPQVFSQCLHQVWVICLRFKAQMGMRSMGQPMKYRGGSGFRIPSSKQPTQCYKPSLQEAHSSLGHPSTVHISSAHYKWHTQVSCSLGPASLTSVPKHFTGPAHSRCSSVRVGTVGTQKGLETYSSP